MPNTSLLPMAPLPMMPNVFYYLSDAYWDAIGDERTNAYLPGGPKWFLTILAIYWMFIFKFGPDYMRDRKPYDLRSIIKWYNIANIVGCTFFVIHGATRHGLALYVFSCDGPLSDQERLIGMYTYLGLKVRFFVCDYSQCDAMLTMFYFLLSLYRFSTFWTQCFSCSVKTNVKSQLFMLFIIR